MSLSQSTGQQPLGVVDGNRIAQSDPFNPLSESCEKPVPTFADESKQHETLHSKLKEQEQTGKQAGAYVSPSDDIMSPASAKLNAFKEKRFAKAGTKPRTLFARATSNSALQNAQLAPEPSASKQDLREKRT